MAQNVIPMGMDDLFTLAEDAADGAAAYGVAVGLKQNDEAALRATLAAARTARTAFLLTQTAKQTLYAAQKSADDNARAFIGLAGKVLGNYLGSRWSMDWAATGFPNQSTAVPGSITERQALLPSLQTYFTNHPGHENAPLNVTAAQAGTLFTALSDARSAVNAGLVDTGQKRAAQTEAVGMLRKRLRGLIEELALLLEDDDPRWLAFGLNMPGADVTPEGPTALVLTPGPEHSVYANWDDVSNADYYRVYVETGAPGSGFVAVPTTFADSDATLGPYSPGQTIRVKVTAVSGVLEGPASDVAEITLIS